MNLTRSLIKELLQAAGICFAYLVVAYPLVIYLCFVVLKIVRSDVQLTYYGYAFPCHAYDPVPYHYTKLASVFTASGPYWVSLFFMLIGIIILHSRLREKAFAFYSGIILLNVQLFYVVLYVFGMSRLYFTNRNLFFKVFHKMQFVTRIVLVIAFVSAVIALLWTITKFYKRLNPKLYIIIAPFAILSFYVIWFYFLGPLVFGDYALKK